jgi:2-phosphosulfolactate phosphatase
LNVYISYDFLNQYGASNSVLYNFNDFCVIIIDVLRASTTITTLLELCSEIYITDNIKNVDDNLIKNSIKIGERDGRKIEGFDFGNSPMELKLNKKNIKSSTNGGKNVILTTTNGTRVIKSIICDNILVGSITNAENVAYHACKIAKEHEKDILLIPCHRKGKFAIEDYIGAGLIAKYILKNIKNSKNHTINIENLLPALNLIKYDWKSLILNSNSANNLKTLGYHEDLIFCITENTQKSVGMFKDGKIVNIAKY